ncbi:hypothetical protein BDD12DRAFT_885410 [Trichophaea hybrida]|nr:hypothetical protein BDD12DRAFT_885410 [Trichophaea hybrida]
MFPETSRAQMLWQNNKSHNGGPNMTKVAEIMKMIATAVPGQTDQIPSTHQVKNINHARFEAAMRYEAPTRAWLKNWLRKNMPLGKNNQNNGEKVILRVYWPITQWFFKQARAITLKQQPVLYAFGVIFKAGTHVDADEVYDGLISTITPANIEIKNHRLIKSR